MPASSVLWLLLAAVVGCRKPGGVVAPPSADACGLQADGSRSFRILHLNDVYRIEGLADGRGGLARVRSLRRQLESDCAGAVLLTHAGDALYPSMLSRQLDGAQMIDVLNWLDGDGGADDARMVATFGNHEFDKGRLEHAEMLQQRIRDSQFAWLDTNLTWRSGTDGPLVAADNLHATVRLDAGGLSVGVFGLTIDNKVPAYIERIDTDYVGIARARTAELRAQGADVVIGLTHLDAADDMHILEVLGDDGPDLILGGHDHTLQTEEVGGRPMLKGDADAVRVRTVEIRVDVAGGVAVRPDAMGVRLDDDTYRRDAAVQARVDHYLQVFEHAFCGDDVGCLAAPLTHTAVDLVAEETRIRRFETNLGDWVADRMLDTFPDADVAVVNSGALRLNQDVAAGTPITREIVEELFAYPAPMHVVQIDGRTLQAVLSRSVEGWTGQGRWLQVAGIAFRHDPERGLAYDVHLVHGGRLTPVEPDATYRLVTVRYLLDPNQGDQDGYTMLSLDGAKPAPADGTDLKRVVLEALAAAGDAGIAPVRAGRICNTLEPEAPCLLDGARP